MLDISLSNLFGAILMISCGSIAIIYSILKLIKNFNPDKGWSETLAYVTGEKNQFYPTFQSTYHIQQLDEEYQIEYVVNNIKYTKYLTNIGHLGEGDTLRIRYNVKRPSQFKEIDDMDDDYSEDKRVGFFDIFEAFLGISMGNLIFFLGLWLLGIVNL
jgi:hypothetical protein